MKTKITKEVVKETVVIKTKKAKTLFTEFKDFLNEYKILGIAAGLMIGSAVTTVTQSLVVGLITPLLQLVIPADSFKSMVYEVAGVRFQYGLVINALINFVVVALLFFLFFKLFLKQEKVTKDSITVK